MATSSFHRQLATRIGPSAAPGLRSKVARLAARLLARMRHEVKLERAETDLLAFDDRLLDDIGIERDEIATVVRHGRRDEARHGP